MKLVFLSGASGFLGAATATNLLSAGVGVRALVRTPQKAQSLAELGAQIVVGDITDPALHDCLRDVDTVIHCAAAIGPASLSREVFYSANVVGTKNLLEGLKNSRSLRRFLHISTVAVVGATDPERPANEESPCKPIDAYGETKLAAERIVLDAARSGFPAVIVRPMWIYGANSPITTNLFRKIGRRKLPMVGVARNTMQPIAIEDAVEGVVKCAASPGVEGRIFNLAGPEILTVRSMCEIIADSMGTTLPKISLPLSIAIPLATLSELLLPIIGVDPPLTNKKLEFFRVCNSYSIERAKQELGWTPKITFQEGARKVAGQLKLASLTKSVQ